MTASDHTTSLKRCTKCGNQYPATLAYFYPDKRNKNGLHAWCKICNREHSRIHSKEWRKANPVQAREIYKRNHEKYKQRERIRRKAYVKVNAPKYAANTRNRRAKLRQADGSHDADDIRHQYEAQKGKCYWCGEKVGKTYHVDHVIPIDRGGDNYPSNLVIACATCNESKSNKLPIEWQGNNGKLL